MKKLFTPCLLLFAVFGLSSCDKEEDTTTRETVDAILYWTGDYAVDGCGYTLAVGEHNFKITNESDIPDSLKDTAGTEVETTILNYHRTESTRCFLPTQMPVVKVLDIRKK